MTIEPVSAVAEPAMAAAMICAWVRKDWHARIDQALAELVEIQNAESQNDKAQKIDQERCVRSGCRVHSASEPTSCGPLALSPSCHAARARHPCRARSSAPALWCVLTSGRKCRALAAALQALLFLEAIAHAIKRFDAVKGLINLIELLAQPLDVAVNGAIIDIDLIVIGGIHQGIAAFDNAGALGKGLQNQKFSHSQNDRLAVPSAGMAVRIHGKLAALDDFGSFCGWADAISGSRPGATQP